jgi:hypothetical protein
LSDIRTARCYSSAAKTRQLPARNRRRVADSEQARNGAQVAIRLAAVRQCGKCQESRGTWSKTRRKVKITRGGDQGL